MPEPKSVAGINNLVIKDLIAEIKKRNLKGPLNILDLGTAEGYNIGRLKEYSQKNGLEMRFTGVDIDTSAYRLSPATDTNILSFNLNEDFHFGDFDFLIATEVIEHVENPYHFIRHCLKNLRLSGLAYISSPNILSLYSALRILILRAPAFFEDDGSGEHITPVSSLTIKKALAFIKKETGQNWRFSENYSKNIIKLPTFIPKVNHRSLNLTIPGHSRLLGQIAYYKISQS